MKQSHQNPVSATMFTLDTLREHWQGHRRLTRRVIELFPEKELFAFSIGGMRTFSEITKELLIITQSGMHLIALNEDIPYNTDSLGISTKEHILNKWDEFTQLIDDLWPRVTQERMGEVNKLFGMYENTAFQQILYFIDNEVHHRGQGYVYLRALGIQPPFFWER